MVPSSSLTTRSGTRAPSSRQSVAARLASSSPDRIESTMDRGDGGTGLTVHPDKGSDTKTPTVRGRAGRPAYERPIERQTHPGRLPSDAVVRANN